MTSTHVTERRAVASGVKRERLITLPVHVIVASAFRNIHKRGLDGFVLPGFPARSRPFCANRCRISRQKMSSKGAGVSSEPSDSMDPFLLILKVPYSALRVPRMRLKVPTLSLLSPMTVFSLVLATYFLVVSGFVYDVIVEPPGIGSTQDPVTGAVKPVVFLSGRVNGQYIIEGLSSGFMFVLGGIGVILLDLALDKHRAKNVRISFAAAGVSFVAIAYVMSVLFVRIKIPSYLR